MAAVIGAALLATGWLYLGDEQFGLELARLARTLDPSATTLEPVTSPTASPGEARAAVASVTAWLGATAHAAPAPGAPTEASAARASEPSAAPTTARDRQSALASLDARLVQQRVLPDAATTDAFTAKSWFVAPPPPPPPPPSPPPPPPPPPKAPPLPFKYMGMLQESADRTVWYLVHGERLIVAATGEEIDATYRIDGSQAGQLQFTYLPLDQRQALAIGGSP